MAEEFQPDYYLKKREDTGPITMKTYGWWVLILGVLLVVFNILTPLNVPFAVLISVFGVAILLLNMEKLMNVKRHSTS